MHFVVGLGIPVTKKRGRKIIDNEMISTAKKLLTDSIKVSGSAIVVAKDSLNKSIRRVVIK